MKILISAYACEPGRGSEPGAGWAWARAAALGHDAWVITRANGARSIEAALRKEPSLRFHPVYVDLPRWCRRWKRLPGGVYLYYILWQFLAWRQAKTLHRSTSFDVAHHLTFAVDWLPAGVAWVPGLPVIWGPVGGSTSMPWRLWRWVGLRGLALELLRETATRPLRRVLGDPTARRAALVVAQNCDVARRFRRARRVVVEPNVALDAAAPSALRRGCRETPGNRTAVFAGRLIHWKAPRLAVAAVARADGWCLEVYGAGPEEAALRELASALDATDRIRLMGSVPRDELLAALASADAFLFPSLHDSASWAVGEALVTGLPVACVDRGGPPVLLARAGGGKAVPATGDIVASLAQALAEVGDFDRSTIDAAPLLGARLPDILNDWYQQAARASGERATRKR